MPGSTTTELARVQGAGLAEALVQARLEVAGNLGVLLRAAADTPVDGERAPLARSGAVEALEDLNGALAAAPGPLDGELVRPDRYWLPLRPSRAERNRRWRWR